MRHSGIDQFCDVRMRETPQDAAFTLEAVLIALANEGGVKKFHRDLSLEAPVATFSQPHAAHTALADCRNQGVRSNQLPRRPRCVLRRHGDGILHESVSNQREMLLDERLQVGGQGGILRRERYQQRLAFLIIHVERLLQVRSQGQPPIWVEYAHGSLCRQISADLKAEIDARPLPVPLNRAHGNTSQGSDFNEGETAEELEVDDFGQRGLDFP